MPDRSKDNPGVHFPPPLLFAVGFAAAWLAHRRWPLPLMRGDARYLEMLGLALGAGGVLFILWGLATFHRHRTGIFPNRPASRIVRDGPYRFTRNPMYVGMTAAYLGLTVMLNDAWPLTALPIVLVALVRLVIAREEQYLASAFSEEYEAYRRSVRRWL
jgi:protein-S-isoprenylcysteine O-methyltransferase Ste14